MDKKTLKIIVLIIFALVLNFNNSFARPFQNPVKTAIDKAEISSSALIGVSVKNINTGKTKFEMNSKAPMSAASVQKVVTLIPTISQLGIDYQFKTTLYKNGNDIYIKLGADPYLTSRDLRNMLAELAKYKLKSINNFYIDDSVMDREEWGEGWQWDNELNVLMPKFGAYNLDKNLITIGFYPTAVGAPVEIRTKVFYPLTFQNNVVTGKGNNIVLDKKNYIAPDVITVTGEISKDTEITIPINNPKKYFVLRLEDSIRKQKVPFYGDIKFAKTPSSAKVVAYTSHPLEQAINDILKNSNNMVAETVFKLAGGKCINGAGTAEKAARMVYGYYLDEGIDSSKIKIVDGSGVSKNNLLTADFITEALLKDYNAKNAIRKYMTEPGETGTLMYRMLYFQNNLRAKTGTLTNVSALAGYITAQSGQTYTFAILINDPKSKSADKKAFEEYTLREIYKSF